jgi:SAM-dependent methyltransferase
MAAANTDAGSFRDPDSAVFYAGDRVLRGLSARGAADWERLSGTTFFPRLTDDGKVVRTTAYEGDAPPSPRGEAWALVLEHERIPFISYPYEWPFHMLRDAAALHLEVVLAALDEGMSTKDGYAYNLQFRGVNPTFIDIGSFEPASGPWPGYRQFCESMLFPLLVQAHLRIAFQPLLRGNLEGITVSDAAGMFRGLRKWKKGVFRNVVLHNTLEQRAKGTTSSQDMKKQLTGAGFGVELQKATVRKLLKVVNGLKVKRKGSTWADYRDTCSYSDADTAAKQTFVRDVVSTDRPATVLDLGANDGAFSLIAAEHANQVVAVDFDELVIDALYLRLREQGVTNVLPLVMNLVDPSPGLGWRNRERAPFSDRARADLVMGLALLHHLAIGANVPLPEVVTWLRSFDARLIVEFVHPEDPMVQRLLANKPPGLFDDYRVDAFEPLFEKQFAVQKRETLPGGTRTLYLADPR